MGRDRGLSDRQVAILRVFIDPANTAEAERGFYAGRIARLAGFERSIRMDAGATRTLDSLLDRGLVKAEYLPSGARKWRVTDAGRDALGEYAFGE